LQSELLDAINKEEDEFRRLNADSIKVILNLISKLEEKLLNPHFIKSVEKKIKRRKFRSNLRHLLFMITRFRISYKQVDDMCSEYNVRNYVYFSLVSIKLMLLGLITFLHFNTPRYPYDKYSNVSFFDYTPDMGIIKSFDLIYKQGNVILDFLYKEIRETNNKK